MAKPDKPVTLKDVADRAGVSTATVSRCINQPETVRPDRRARVEAAVAALGYIPHGAAKALASKRSRMIGAVFPRLNSILFGSFFGELQRQLDDVGYLLVVSTSGYNATTETAQVRHLVSRGVDGVVLVGHDHSEEVARTLTRNGIPYVVTWAWNDAASAAQIGFANAEGMAKMADYVAGLGHRRIALISGETGHNDRARDRLEGARTRLRELGPGLPEDMIERVPFEIDEGAAAFARLMDRPEPPTAVLCGSDLFAFGALREARRRGLRVPGDVTVVGFDDTELAACTIPALTTLRTPRTLMATRTAEALIDRLENNRELRSIRLETDLIIRESSGLPPD